MKIFCIGRNYAKHASELNNPVPENPVVFMKAPTALLKNSQAFYYPDFSDEIHFEGEVVLRIGKNGKAIAPKFAEKYIEAITLGIDFTARDLQQKLKEKGLPWELSKSFDGAAAIGSYQDFQGFEKLNKTPFEIFKNKAKVQEATPSEMLFPFDELLAFISEYFTLQQGDLIYTGTPAGVGPVKVGDELTGHLDGKQVLKVAIK